MSIIETTTNLDIHLLSDASINGVCTVAYAVIYQSNNISQVLITIKSRLVKRNLATPRFELIAAQMSANLAQNIKNALNNQNIINFYAWSYSTVILYWLKHIGKYKVFVSNRVAKIREHSNLEWNYVPTRNNLADLGRRSCELSKL